MFHGIFSKGSARKNGNIANRIGRDMAGTGEAEGNFKVKVKVELLLNGKEAENSNADKLNSTREPAYFPLIGDSYVIRHSLLHLEN